MQRDIQRCTVVLPRCAFSILYEELIPHRIELIGVKHPDSTKTILSVGHRYETIKLHVYPISETH